MRLRNPARPCRIRYTTAILNISVLAFLLVAARLQCFALAADHLKGELAKASHWPTGVAELVNWPGGEIKIEKDKLPAGMTIEKSKE